MLGKSLGGFMGYSFLKNHGDFENHYDLMNIR